MDTGGERTATIFPLTVKSTALSSRVRVSRGELLHGKYAERATCRRERRGCGEEVRVSGLSMLRLEQLQVGGLRHGLIPGAVRVEKVSGMIPGEKPGRTLRIAHGRIEINHPVVDAARANPVVDRRAHSLALRRVAARSLERRQGRTVDPEPAGVRPFDQLAMGRNQDGRSRPGASTRHANVVDAFEDDDVGRTWLSERIPIEPRQGVHAEAGIHLAEDAVAADADVDDARISGP